MSRNTSQPTIGSSEQNDQDQENYNDNENNDDDGKDNNDDEYEGIDLSEASMDDIFTKLNEILPEMEKSVCVKHASYLTSASDKYCNSDDEADKLGRHLVSLNFVEIFQRYWIQNFDVVVPEDCDPLKWKVAFALLLVVYNMSDGSTTLCERILNTDLHLDIFRFLGSKYLDPQLMINKKPYKIADALISTLHNVVRRVSSAREKLRACDAVERLQPFRECSSQMISLFSLLIQSYLITEVENEKINSNDDVFELIVKILDLSMKNESLDDGSQVSAIEMLEALNNLATNDENKKRIVKNGALPYFVDLMSSRWTAREQAEAAHGLWLLAFKCKEDIQKQPGCMEALKSLLQNSDEKVRKEAEGALWILEDKNKPATKVQDRAKKAKEDGHVFISYQWDSKATVLKISEQLRAAGFQVWIDEDDMSGSVLDAMAAAVENASVIIVCLSEKYKESPNCRTEAEYTFRLKKKIIPLRLQTKYYPDGWLGLMVGSKLVLNFSEPSRVQENINQLIKELGGARKEVGENDLIKPVSVPEINAPNYPSQDKTSPIKFWTKEDVGEWVKKNNLDKVKKWFSTFNGSLLLEYNAMRQEAPESFYAYMLKKNIPLTDALAISRALKEL